MPASGCSRASRPKQSDTPSASRRAPAQSAAVFTLVATRKAATPQANRQMRRLHPDDTPAYATQPTHTVSQTWQRSAGANSTKCVRLPSGRHDNTMRLLMTRALGLAAQALFLSNPNPRVGCVITAPNGQVLGEGFTQQAGGPHAEVMALRDAARQGHDNVRGATAWVTLEPCAHQGRTGPCCDALIAAGIGKVSGQPRRPQPPGGGPGLCPAACGRG
jgi:pyrimidine deaminase RibD-like protein